MERQKQDLKEEMTQILEEARMVLPGVQALFGFQTIVFFNERFHKLSDIAVRSHELALSLVVISIALLMTPAAYHRVVESGMISRQTINVASRFIRYSMIPLSIAIALDIYTVLSSVHGDSLVPLVCGITTSLLLTGLWFLFPLLARRRREKLDVL